MSSSILALIFSRLAWMNFYFYKKIKKVINFSMKLDKKNGRANNQVISGESDPWKGASSDVTTS